MLNVLWLSIKGKAGVGRGGGWNSGGEGKGWMRAEPQGGWLAARPRGSGLTTLLERQAT